MTKKISNSLWTERNEEVSVPFIQILMKKRSEQVFLKENNVVFWQFISGSMKQRMYGSLNKDGHSLRLIRDHDEGEVICKNLFEF